MVAMAVAVAAVATIAVAGAMGALVTETVKAAVEVQQQPKKRTVRSSCKQIDHGFCVAGPRANLLSRIGTATFATVLIGIRITHSGRGFESHNQHFLLF